MDDGVQADQPGHRARSQRESGHVRGGSRQPGGPGDRAHAGGQVEPDRPGAAAGQVRGDVARAAPDVGYQSTAGELGHRVQQPAVERLVGQLAADLGGVPLGDPVVARPRLSRLRHADARRLSRAGGWPPRAAGTGGR